MEKYFALIKNKLVEGIVVADDSFLSHIQEKYDLIIDVTNRNRPSLGDSYYSDVDIFINASADEHVIPTETINAVLQNGTEEGFEPFTISTYSVSYADGMIQIGCKKYSALGMLDTLHKLLIDKKKTTTYFTALEKGPTHGKFGITWDDAWKIYNALLKVKL